MNGGPDSVGDVVLETQRLLLRRWRVADAAFHRELWTERDPRVPPHRQIDLDGRPTVSDMEEWIRREAPDPSLGLLVIELRATGERVGYCGLIANHHGQDGEPELAYELLQSHWGNGYATEASQAVLGWAAGSGFRRLWATIRDWNLPSRRVMERLGFEATDRVEVDAEYGDTMFYTRAL